MWMKGKVLVSQIYRQENLISVNKYYNFSYWIREAVDFAKILVYNL